VQTVEGLTGLRVDHLAVIDFAGFQALVDAVDGIDVATGTGPIVSHLDGEAALKFVRQRQAEPLGDLDRVRQEQMALRALLVKAMSNGALTDPGGLYRLLDAARTSVGVDDTLTNGRLRAVAADLRKVQPTAVRFVQAPIERWGSEGNQPVAYLAPYATELWSALRSDTLDNYLYQHSTG
jgi:anionic cell wall polymer biosynthesis LytR-Cps2A-Psr (LCP) family protein